MVCTTGKSTPVSPKTLFVMKPLNCAMKLRMPKSAPRPSGGMLAGQSVPSTVHVASGTLKTALHCSAGTIGIIEGGKFEGGTPAEQHRFDTAGGGGDGEGGGGDGGSGGGGGEGFGGLGGDGAGPHGGSALLHPHPQ